MADILIKGMEMPEIENNHGIKAEIRMLNGKLELGIMTGGYYCSQEWTYYPLVEIPEHGRLIDADALSNEFAKKANAYYEYGRQFSSSFWSGGEICTEWYAVDEILENAPTVIPASGKEET